VLQAAFEKLREKIDEAKAEKGSGCEA
jgi:hypothetical protein